MIVQPTRNPKISICLPNLNNRRFLEDRIASIYGQSFEDWELIVCDSHSEDGAWEYFQGLRNDPRVRLFQVPREGIYAGWNECLKRARGRYVYFATSDDTMDDTCIEKMVAELEAHPDCGLCHCSLTIIDDKGQVHANAKPWDEYDGVLYFGPLIGLKHLRPAPHDGLLAVMLEGVYLSITQLLIRRTLFDSAGLFETKWGPLGDYAWYVRAGLLTSTIHLPEALATWRHHPNQASQYDHYLRAHADGTMLRIAEQAMEHAALLNPMLSELKGNSQIRRPLRGSSILARLLCAHGKTRRLRANVRASLADPIGMIHAWRFSNSPRTRISFAREQLGHLGITGPETLSTSPIPGSASNQHL
jgi:glycosyltransferase involved in cell wall biosynthesis